MNTIITTLLVVSLFILGCNEGDTIIYQSPDDWQPPVLEWLYQPDAEVRGTIGIDIDITDSSDVEFARLYIDGSPANELTAAPYRFEIATDSLDDGVHVLEVRAEDAYGNLGISPILRINIANSVAQGPQLIWVPDDYALIQAAINASTDFDTIRVRDGVYYETLNLFGKGIWVESENGPMGCTINAFGTSNVFFVPPSQEFATIRGFAMRAAFIQIRMDDGAQLRLFNNLFLSTRWQPEFGYDSTHTFILTGSVSGLVVNNLFIGGNTSLQLYSFLGDVKNNVLMNAYDFALWNSSLSVNPMSHSYNCFWQNNENYARFIQEIGEFDANPLIDSENGQLLPGSPCIDSGDPTIFDLDNTRSDIGPFGGPLMYP